LGAFGRREIGADVKAFIAFYTPCPVIANRSFNKAQRPCGAGLYAFAAAAAKALCFRVVAVKAPHIAALQKKRHSAAGPVDQGALYDPV
jgi:hypothetical protein